MKRFIKIITFKEFKDFADDRGYIFPLDFEERSDKELGVVSNNTFVPIDFSFEAEQILKH